MVEQRAARLGEDRNAPFTLAKGDLVALKLSDGSADQTNVGIIIDGLCYYAVPGRFCEDFYVVRRADGKLLWAPGTELFAITNKT